MEKKASQFIIKKKRRKKIKKIIILSIIFFIAFTVFLFKAPFFKIKSLNVKGNKIISTNEIIKLSKVSNNDNIFYIKIKDVEKNIKRNPYISEVSIKRDLPNKLSIMVKEKPAAFYIVKDNKYYILNDELRILEKTDTLDKNNLLEIKGIDPVSTNIGEVISKNNKQLEFGKDLYDVIRGNKSNIKFDSINILNPYNITLYSGDVKIDLGSYEDLEKKINKAINILDNKDIKFTKGYIDLSFKGNPVIKQES